MDWNVGLVRKDEIFMGNFKTGFDSFGLKLAIPAILSYPSLKAGVIENLSVTGL
jgi:hypothetical protein